MLLTYILSLFENPVKLTWGSPGQSPIEADVGQVVKVDPADVRDARHEVVRAHVLVQVVGAIMMSSSLTYMKAEMRLSMSV
jgi:hypothetical protein